jgi:O-6-methylguanine DNA methyltransferase
MHPSTVRFGRAETPLGRMWLAETDAGLAASSRGLPLDEFLGRLRRRFPRSVVEADAVDGSWVARVVDGGPLPQVDLGGLSAFDAAVYEVVRSIRPGETMTYGEVALAVGSPGAARAVGGAMGRCPLFPAVPCHRVVRAADGWSGWGGDPALKRRLLLAERGAPFPT